MMIYRSLALFIRSLFLDCDTQFGFPRSCRSLDSLRCGRMPLSPTPGSFATLPGAPAPPPLVVGSSAPAHTSAGIARALWRRSGAFVVFSGLDCPRSLRSLAPPRPVDALALRVWMLRRSFFSGFSGISRLYLFQKNT